MQGVFGTETVFGICNVFMSNCDTVFDVIRTRNNL
jgi:hypothetical protein